MIGSLEVTHELIFTIPSVIQICSNSSINSIRLRFYLGKPRIDIQTLITQNVEEVASFVKTEIHLIIPKFNIAL